MAYLKDHWLDIVTCIPVVGQLRALRLLRLLAFVRIGAAARAFGVGMSASKIAPGGTDKGVTCFIFVLARRLADNHYLRSCLAVARHRFGAALRKRAQRARLDVLGQLSEPLPTG